MLRFSSLPRPVLMGLATLFAAAATLYSAIWMYYVRWEPSAQLGIQFEYSLGAQSSRVIRVMEGSAAARAGLRPDDRIVAINGDPLVTPQPFYAAITRGQPGDVVQLRVERPGVSAPLNLQAVLLPRPPQLDKRPWSQELANQVLGSYPAWFLLVGFAVLFLRLEDRNAWLLALFFACFIAGPPLLTIEGRIHPALRGFALFYALTFNGLATGVFYYFFAVFPTASPLDRRVPWLKGALLAISAALAVPLGLWVLWAGSSRPLLLLVPAQQYWRFGAYGMSAVRRPDDWYAAFTLCLVLATYVMGLVSLVWNSVAAPTAEARRKTRVLVWGTVVGLTPSLVMFAAAAYLNKPYYQFPFWVWAPIALLSLLLPLSFAYAVVKHRVLPIPQLLRQGLQYALARGVLLSLVPALAAVLLVDLLVHGEQPLLGILRARGWIYAVVGALALAAHSRRQRWLESLDRRFFRERYDAQRLLREVAEEVRQAGSFEQVAPRVVARVEAALHPEFAALLVRRPRELSYRTLAAAPDGQAPAPLPAESKLVALLRLLGKPLEVRLTETSWLKQQLPHEETDFLRQSRMEFLLPIATGPQRTEALLVLGPKRSEEPYTPEDRDLLGAIATSLALLLEKPGVAPPPPSDGLEECPQCGTCYDTGARRCAREGAVLNLVPLPRLLAARYRLERRLGRGGMGTVYEASDTALERRVAVKVILEDLVGSAEAAERFRREARAAASFTHPNVVTVHDFGVAAGTRAFLVMELLEGVTLREELRRQKRLSAARTLEILRGVSAAVDSAHRRQLIHRDLKPENIFLVRSETEQPAKVLDFGVAKFLHADAQMTADTRSGLLVGTLYYMAPEQLLGQDAHAAWDLWALAVVSYEMLTGAHPFAVTDPAQWQSALLAGRFTPLAAHLPEAPARWQEFFARALARQPEQRPGSAQLFFSELERALV